MEAEKYLGYWMECVMDGRLPSGMNEGNKLGPKISKFVMGYQKGDSLRYEIRTSLRGLEREILKAISFHAKYKRLTSSH